MVHLHNGVLYSMKNDGILKFADKWMDLENIVLGGLNEETLTQKDKYHMYSLISGF